MKPVVFARLFTPLTVVYTVWFVSDLLGGDPASASACGAVYFVQVLLSSVWFYLFFQHNAKSKRILAAKVLCLLVLIPLVFTLVYQETTKFATFGFNVWQEAGIQIAARFAILSLQVGFVNGLVGVRPWLWYQPRRIGQ